MRYNDYTCQKCGKKTVTRNAPEVVTPMFFTCRHCKGMAVSSGFQNDNFLASMQDHPEARATHEFFYDKSRGGQEQDQLAVREVK